MGAGEKILLAALVDPAWDLIQMTGMLGGLLKMWRDVLMSTIMVIDDSPFIVDIFVTMLERGAIQFTLQIAALKVLTC